MSTIEEFIKQNLGRTNVTPKGLMLEAYAMGVAHGKGEEYEQEPEEEEVEESVQEEDSEEVGEVEEEDEGEEEEGVVQTIG